MARPPASPRTSISSAACAPGSFPTARTCCASRSTWRARTSTCAIRRSTGSGTRRHHRTGDKWCVYPLYDYTHCISDALERITHSICTLEFQDHRPLYDWIIEKLADGGQLERPLPQQYEFARLNLTYVVLSKRRFIELIEKGHVDGWDDPRMPTLVGARRRGFTPEGFQLFAERIGVSKSDSWIDMSVLEDCMRDDLNARAPRRIAVLDPVKLVIDNFPEGASEECFAPNHPHHPELGRRSLPLTRELWIERDDYTEHAAEGLFPSRRRAPRCGLRYGYIVRCVGADKDADGNVTAVHCTYDPQTRSGTPGADARKVKGNIHWLSAAHAVAGGGAPLRPAVRGAVSGLAQSAGRARGRRRGPGGAGPLRMLVAGEDDDEEARRRPSSAIISTTSTRHRSASSPRSSSRRWRDAAAEERFQFERHGYFVADLADHAPGKPVFNRTVTLRDSWAKPGSRVVRAAHDARRSSSSAMFSRPTALRWRPPESTPGDPSMKRIVLFLATNLAVVLVLSIVLRLLGLDRAMYSADRHVDRRAARVLGRRRLHRRDHLAADVEVDGQMVDRRAGDRSSRRTKPRPGWSRRCASSPQRPASACRKSRSTKARRTPSPPARSGIRRWSRCRRACCSR